MGVANFPTAAFGRAPGHARGQRGRRSPSENSEQRFQSPTNSISDSTISTDASYKSARSSPSLLPGSPDLLVLGITPLWTPDPNPVSGIITTPNRQTRRPAQTGHPRRVGDHPSSASGNQSLFSPILLPQSRKWESVSPAFLEILEVASDSESLLRLSTDGSVSAGNLEGLVSRIVTGTADTYKDGLFRDAFLTVYRLFATSSRLFKILKRRFWSTELKPADIRSRSNILLFIENWLKCSAMIKEFALSIRGSGTSRTMEEKAQEICSLIDNPHYVRLRQPGNHARLRREFAERPRQTIPFDLAAALTVLEGDRFKSITYWDYVNFTRGRSNMRRIEAFNTVHDMITEWVKRTVLDNDDLGERKKKYEEWIHTAQACRNMNNFSSAAAIVIALTSSVITSLSLTCSSEAKRILHALARDLSPADGAYQNMLQQVMTTDLIPWLDPLLSSLSLTFTHSNPIVEVDGHPLIDFKQCIRLAEQIGSLVRYSPPRVRTPPDVLAYVKYSLNSCIGDDQTQARSA